MWFLNQSELSLNIELSSVDFFEEDYKVLIELWKRKMKG